MIFLIGHRGVGKSTFLHLTKNANLSKFKDYQFFDLDEEIQNRVKRTTPDIFAKDGEKKFRQLEQEVLSTLAQENTMISVGAGCNLDNWKNKARIIWLKRITDQDGRIFLNRPRLLPDRNEWQESLDLYKDRSKLYAKWSHQAWYIPEYIEDLKKMIPLFWQRGDCRYFDSGIFTVRPENHTIYTRCALELRDDLLSHEEMKLIFQQWPRRRYMISFRKPQPNLELLKVFARDGNIFDWDLSLGDPPQELLDLPLMQFCLSSHEDTPPEGQCFLKWAPLVTEWQQLIKGHQWWQKDPRHRAFFPRSVNGRWQWYRELFSRQMAFYFFREDEGSALDQPFWWQTELQPEQFQSFAAVLGNPVKHSWTPGFQRDFFMKYSMPVVAISVTEEEWPHAIPVLEKIGLRAAAVTSPLKKLSADLVKNPSAKIREMESCNTLAYKNGEWLGENTDIQGVLNFKEISQDTNVVLWGSGAMAKVVAAAWPHIKVVAQRTGSQIGPELDPSTVVWAVGRSRMLNWPPKQWKPKVVADLNYTDDSPGREFAKMVGADYVSGEAMFTAQAEAQQAFWKEVL